MNKIFFRFNAREKEEFAAVVPYCYNLAWHVLLSSDYASILCK
jgi:hypothetical protein